MGVLINHGGESKIRVAFIRVSFLVAFLSSTLSSTHLPPWQLQHRTMSTMGLEQIVDQQISDGEDIGGNLHNDCHSSLHTTTQTPI